MSPINQIRFSRTSVSPRSAITASYEIADRFLSIVCSDTSVAESAHEFLAMLRAVRMSKPGNSGHAELALLKRSEEIPSELTPCFKSSEAGAAISYYSAPDAYAVKLGKTVVSARCGRDVTVSLAPDLDCRSFLFHRVLTHGFTAAMRRLGAFELHCAAVVDPESSRGILLVGPSGSGKSTLALQLAAGGWNYCTDDVVLLTESETGVEAHGLRNHFAVTSETIGHSQLRSVEASALKPAGMDNKVAVVPERYFPAEQFRKCSPRLLVFVSRQDNVGTSTRGLTQAETMKRLLGICPWVGMDLPMAPHCVNVLSRLAQQSRSFELQAGPELLGNEHQTSGLLRSMLDEA